MLGAHPFRDAPVRKLPSAQIRPRISRWTIFAALGGIAAVWNAICGWQLAIAIGSGRVAYVAVVAVFALPGVAMIGSAVRAFLAVFNPAVEILGHVEQPALGEPFELHWRLTGKASRVQQLQIDLEGTEAATYRRGTDVVTDRHIFVSLTIATTRDRAEIAEGKATIVFPEAAVPSFTAKNNSIVWRLIVRGDVPSWPDIHDVFTLDVVAHPRVRRKAAA